MSAIEPLTIFIDLSLVNNLNFQIHQRIVILGFSTMQMLHSLSDIAIL
jgi:hypothetical protein